MLYHWAASPIPTFYLFDTTVCNAINLSVQFIFPSLFSFAIFSLYFWCFTQKIMPTRRSWKLRPLLSGGFYIFTFTFESVTHLVLIIAHSIKSSPSCYKYCFFKFFFLLGDICERCLLMLIYVGNQKQSCWQNIKTSTPAHLNAQAVKHVLLCVDMLNKLHLILVD